jgi:cyclic beta-1,2-glucan synthetase
MAGKHFNFLGSFKWLKTLALDAARAFSINGRRKIVFSHATPVDQPLRLELFSDEKLETHARNLAPTHQLAQEHGQDILLQRLDDNEGVLQEAYAALIEAVRKKQRISPAAEWLLDNFHVIEEQIHTARRHLPAGYSRTLPHLQGKNVNKIGYPRVYAIALEVIAHVDGRVDKENISKFVSAYQQVTKLTLGECWAVPIMLRLALIENLRRVAFRVIVGIKDREAANHWADKLIAVGEKEPKNLILVTADMARSDIPFSNSFVAELLRRLQGQGQLFYVPLSWIDQQLSDLGSSTQKAIHRESQQQAANQVSVGSSISSLRFLSAIDWRDFVESHSSIDRELNKDPAGFYNKMTFATRDQYRRVVEVMAKKGRIPEDKIARLAVSLAKARTAGTREHHVGYFLIDEGLDELKRSLGITSKFRSLLKSQDVRPAVFFGSIFLLSVLITGLILSSLDLQISDSVETLFICGLLFLISSQVAVALVNWLATLLVCPSSLPRLDFSSGIPAEHRTLVAVPTMLINPANVSSLLEGLEVRYLANRDENLHYLLLTDFADARTEHTRNDDVVLKLAVEGITALNRKYACKDHPTKEGNVFHLLHRARTFSPKQGVWMGHERKRGKLKALNLFLRTYDRSTFDVVVGDLSKLSTIKYVITLDTDTLLPRDAARELAGTMGHPLNRPVYDDKLGRVIRGYSILQPRVAISLPGSRASRFVQLSSGETGVDPYTRAVSDVYQDVFNEGSFIGKGIYDVDAFSASLNGRFPDDLILSHDLIEGIYARCGLVSDVLLYEDFPSNYADDAKRRSRWIRGDWQILQWLLPFSPSEGGSLSRNQLPLLSKWKIADNLRRSLVPIALLLLLVLTWIFDSLNSDSWSFAEAVAILIFLPPLMTTLAEGTRKPSELGIFTHLGSVFGTIANNACLAFLSLIMLPFEAFLSGKSILISLSRMCITGKNLLEWNPASSSKSTISTAFHFYRFMIFTPILSALVAIYMWKTQTPFGPAIFFLSVWLFSPLVAYVISSTRVERDAALSVAQTSFLRNISRKTWNFFEVFVGPEDNWLPPDNFQEYPKAVIAHRTSPTNIGLSLLANLSAYDFGYLSAQGVLSRTKNTFGTLARMDRFRGHFLNWYDTTTLAPLHPSYVSTVDSGNFIGFLLTLRQGLFELPQATVVTKESCLGLQDTLNCLIEEIGASADTEKLSEALANPPQTFSEVKVVYEHVRRFLSSPSVTSITSPIRWLSFLKEQADAVLLEPLAMFEPLFGMIKHPDEISRDSQLSIQLRQLEILPSWQMAESIGDRLAPLIREVELSMNSSSALEWCEELRNVCQGLNRAAASQIALCHTLANECLVYSDVEYDFLYDRDRHLFSIGYNVSEHRRDTGFYDLLASEARMASFVAISEGAVPQEHWFRLGRLLTTTQRGSTLLSWSGSMFEYLMPLLVMPTFEETLLDQTYKTSVKRQVSYGSEHGIPWGVSESGYNTTDVNLNYQYRAFGVPGLGFKRGLAEDLVLAPYASVMAVMIAPIAATLNMLRMRSDGFEGKYGFYEAVDYTPSRLSLGHSHAVVRSYMAHHLGMSFLAIAYQVLDRRMQFRFRMDPQFKATELLLHERVPKVVSVYPHAAEVLDPQSGLSDLTPALRVIDRADTHRPEVHLLSNGRYSVMITNSGGGYSLWKNLALTRWREDPTSDNFGMFCYLRDVVSGDLWSATHQPTLASGSHYEAIFPQGKAEFRRSDRDIELHMEITISPEDDIEMRRLNITNLGTTKRVIEFTSYAEVVLAPQAADEAHQAFSNLFVQTELLPSKQAILCKRRPRSNSDLTPTMFHLMTVHGQMVGDVSYETDRSRFLGRGGNVHDAAAFRSSAIDLSGSAGSVLDPIVAIRCRVALEPEQTAQVHIVTGVGKDRVAALSLIEKYSDRHLSERVFELSWTHRQVVLRQLNVSEVDAQLYGRLASSIVYTNPLRRAEPEILSKNRRGQSGLWGYGISGDLPIILLCISSLENSSIVRQLVQAHGYWSMMGLAVDLVIWNEDDSTYRQDLNDSILDMIGSASFLHQMDRPGGIYVRRSDQMSEEDRNLMQTVARAIIVDTHGSLADQMVRRARMPRALDAFVPTRAIGLEIATGESRSWEKISDLQFFNGTGGFSPDGREYVIVTGRSQATPAPWCNVIANPHFGSVVSESGSAYTWCENAHEYRLTPWTNDALTDSTGEAIFIRDEETGRFWSPTPLPVKSDATYVTRHGFGYSSFETSIDGVYSKLTTYVAIDAPIKLNSIRVKNTSSISRRLSMTGYCEWVLGEFRAKSLMHIVSEVDPKTNALFIRNPYHPEFGGRVGFFDVSEKDRAYTCDRTEFLGRNRFLGSPAAMFNAKLSGKVGAALDSCSAMQTSFELAPGEEKEIVFMFGVARDVDDARILLHRFGTPQRAHDALDIVQDHWSRILGAVQIKTPDHSLNILMNGWLIYQVLSSRVWGRSGYYQSGGAYGFRDQLQDTMSLIHTEPTLLKEQILRCASRQFREGDVQHWWHPPSGFGVRTHFSDDYLWLPLATSRYVLGTGDTGVLHKRIHFIEGRQVNFDEEAYGDLPARSDESATLYEHCVRAIRNALKFGRNGLPLIGCGDWNDGMNLIGEHGRGESVWLAFFLCNVLEDFSKVAAIHDDQGFAALCLGQAKLLKDNIEANTWDGQWYRRAYFDNGEPVGSAQNMECQIDSIPQSWAVLSSVGSVERAEMAMDSMYKRLVDKASGVIKLFDPPFDVSPMNPGYIKGYVPGVRENGGQYTHAAIWAAMAFAKLKDKARAWELLGMINPISHSDTADKVATYKVEPFVAAADVYAVAPHVGRGGWTWYTGSASWLYRLILESLLGLKLDVDQLTLEPCIPSNWSGFSIQYRYRETIYNITVKMTTGADTTTVTVDGVPQMSATFRLIDDNIPHVVEITTPA